MFVRLRNQKGSIMFEMVVSMLILVGFFFSCIEVFSVVKDRIYIQKIAREGAREASLTGKLEPGQGKAQDCARQYFNSKNVHISVEKITNNNGDINVACYVTRPHQPFSFLNQNGMGVINLEAQAIYPWWDENRNP